VIKEILEQFEEAKKILAEMGATKIRIASRKQVLPAVSVFLQKSREKVRVKAAIRVI
jgi:hypothetical protein